MQIWSRAAGSSLPLWLAGDKIETCTPLGQPLLWMRRRMMRMFFMLTITMTSQRLPVPLSLQHTHQNNLRNNLLSLSSFQLLFVSQPDLYLKVRHTTSLIFLQRVCHGRHFFARAACFLRLLRAIFQIDLLLTWAFAACVREETP